MKKNENPEYQELEKFYAEQEDHSSGVIDRRGGSFWKRLVKIGFGLVVLASVVAWLSFYVFGVFDARPTGDVSVTVTAPDRAAIGETVTYTLQVKNAAFTAAQDVSVRANYPDGFLYRSATLTPEGASKNMWSFARLEPGSTKEIIVSGVLIGEEGSLATFFLSATYEAENFRSELETSDSAATVLEPLRMTIEVDGPTDVKPDEEVEYRVRYSHDGESRFPGGVLRLLPPDAFSVASIDPAPATAETFDISLAERDPGERGEVLLKGKWAGTVDGAQILRLQVLIPTSNGIQVPVKDIETTTVVNSGDIGLSLSINGGEEIAAVALGDTLRLALRVENRSDRIISDIEASIGVAGSLVDWSRATLVDGARLHNDSILWTSSEAPAVERLLPKAAVTLVADVPLVVSPSSGEGAWSIALRSSFLYRKVDEDAVDRRLEGAEIIVPVNTPVSLSVEGRYFDIDGTPLGAGPLPPQAGRTTRYALRWKLSGAVHRLTNVVVRATLPNQITLADEAVSPSFGTFAVEDGNPVWRITALEAGVEPTIDFSVSLEPTPQDVGKILIISGQTTLTATDDETNGQVSAAGSVATTNLDGDRAAQGKGVVEAAP